MTRRHPAHVGAIGPPGPIGWETTPMVHLPEVEREAIAAVCEWHAVALEVDRTKQLPYAA